MSNELVETQNLGINDIDMKQVEGVIKALSKDAELGVSLTRAHTVWKGGFRVDTEVKGFNIVSDEPCSLGGTDKAPNPMAILLGAYGACFGITYILIASTRGIKIEKIEIELEGYMDTPLFLALSNPKGSEAKPGFNEIHSKLFVRGAAPMKDLEEVHDLAIEMSPVGQTLARKLKVKNEFSKVRLS